jgi:hypothetical protein
VAGDAHGSVAAVRRRFDDGGYRHVGELSMSAIHEVDVASLSISGLQAEQESFRDSAHVQMMRELG